MINVPFEIEDFEFLRGDDTKKIYNVKGINIVFEKSWMGLIGEESKGEIETNPSLERMYYDMSPYISITTSFRGLNINERLHQGSLDQAVDFFDSLTTQICAIIYLGTITLTLE